MSQKHRGCFRYLQDNPTQLVKNSFIKNPALLGENFLQVWVSLPLYEYPIFNLFVLEIAAARHLR